MYTLPFVLNTITVLVSLCSLHDKDLWRVLLQRDFAFQRNVSVMVSVFETPVKSLVLPLVPRVRDNWTSGHLEYPDRTSQESRYGLVNVPSEN